MNRPFVFFGNEKPLDVSVDKDIEDITFKWGKLECHIALWRYIIAIFITNTLEIMFIKDEDRPETSSSDTQGNVVFNGLLEGKSNKEILQLLADMVVLFNGAESFCFSEEEIYRVGLSYPRCNYTINIYKKDAEPQDKVFENITFRILPTT